MNQDQILHLFYTHVLGRAMLKPFVCRPFSVLAGRFMDSGLSRFMIPSCIKKMEIPMEQYEEEDYSCYNDFFTRRIKPSFRPFPADPEKAVSPCDGLVTVLPIRKFSRLLVKQTPYTLGQIFRSRRLADQYEGGTAVIIRLTVSDYHRYCYPVSGKKSVNRKIPGKFHTVNPIANDYVPIYKENSREYTRISSPRYGDVVQMEVGALCVGRIVNYEEKATVFRGMEKGRFEFGGSTIILFFEKDRLKIRRDLWGSTLNGVEHPIRMGEALEDMEW